MGLVLKTSDAERHRGFKSHPLRQVMDEELELKPDGWQGKLLSGYIFLAVDSIELRSKFVEAHLDSPYVKAVFDFRTLLESAQHYAAEWEDYAMKQNLLKTMQFSHEEAKA